jgi:hypothetical protein
MSAHTHKSIQRMHYQFRVENMDDCFRHSLNSLQSTCTYVYTHAQVIMGVYTHAQVIMGPT